MQGLRSLGGLQRFLAVFSAVRNLFVPPRSHHSSLANLHQLDAMAKRKAVAGVAESTGQEAEFASLRPPSANGTMPRHETA